MKDLEKVGNMLKQFIEEAMVEANKIDEELAAKKVERDDKDKEIEDVRLQIDYLDMLRLQLEEKLELLEEERAIIDSLVLEREEMARRNRLENIIDSMETNDGEEIIDEGK